MKTNFLGKTSFVRFVMVLLASLFLVSVAGDKAIAAEETYKIGVVLSLTGGYASAGRHMLVADEIAAEEFNKAGGILGRKIELEVRDDQLKVETSVRVTKELIERHKVNAILGASSSHCTLAMMSVTSEHNVLHITGCPNSEKLVVQEFKRNYFQVSPNTYMEVRAEIKFVIDDPKLKTYGTLGHDYEYGRSGANIIKEILAKERPDMKLVGQWWVPLGETQLTGYITAMLAANPDAILGVMGVGGLPPFVKQAKQYGFFEKIKYIQYIPLDDVVALGKEMPEGIRAVLRYPFYAISTPKMKAFVKKFYDREGAYPDEYGVMTYDAFYALMAGIKKANSFDNNAIIEAMENMTFEACSGKRYFRKVDHQMDSPYYVGVMGFVPDYPFAIIKNPTVMPAEKIWRAPEEVLKLREAAKK
jgi:branched-chain amino acid transport system substrate-binding protein